MYDMKEFTLTAGKYASWDAMSRHANERAGKPWAGVVTGPDDEYGVALDWLERQTIDGAVHFDMTPVEAGDYIKVSGASHNNQKHAYYRIEAVTDDEIIADRVSEAEVIEAVAGNEDEISVLRTEVIRAVVQVDDKNTLTAIKDIIEE